MKRDTILIVEDNTITADSLSALLGDRGYKCETAANGEAALTKLEANRYGLLIIDHYMPGMDGIETMQRARKLNRTIPAVWITAAPDHVITEAREDLQRIGKTAVVRKPFGIDDILTAMDAVGGMDRDEAASYAPVRCKPPMENLS